MRRKEIVPILCAVLAWAVCNLADAAPVGTNDAARAVRAWVSRGGMFGAGLRADVASVGIHTTTNGARFYSVQTVDGGTVFTSADDELEPILAFSSERASAAVADDPRSPLAALLRRDIAGRTTAKPSAKRLVKSVSAPQTASRWSRLLAEADRRDADAKSGVRRLAKAAAPVVGDLRVAPLVKTKWGQDVDGCGKLCYNYSTPGNFFSGCVATAMAQILFYHKWPQTSRPSVTKSCFVEGVSKYLTTSGGPYDWDRMPLEPNGADAAVMTEDNRQAIGKLCCDAGVSVRMNWDSQGSGAFVALVGEALREVFGYGSAYSSDCEDGGDQGSSLFDANISHKVLSNLDAGCPVILGIGGDAVYHAVVGDGYGYNDDTLYVHLNMGWCGANDVWYNLPEIGSEFSSVDEIVYNIIPDGGDGRAVLSGRVTLPDGVPAASASVAIYAVDGADEPVTNVVANDYGVYGAILPAGVRYEARATRVGFSGSVTMSEGETLGAPSVSALTFSAEVGGRQLMFSTKKFVDGCSTASRAAGCYGNRARLDVSMSEAPGGAGLTWEELAEAFGDVVEVTDNIVTDSQLEAFNGFLSRAGVASVADLSPEQKACIYSSFVLSDILAAPVLFEVKPELTIDGFAPKTGSVGEWTLTVSLHAGKVDAAMVAARLAERIRVGTAVDDITRAPTLSEVPEDDASALTFAINPDSGGSFFVRVVVSQEGIGEQYPPLGRNL